ncbi:MAG: hypothetical protein LUC37_01820 [Prevotella sp.]|nr:hypothetical protein [Prevotella sp.]
MSTLKSFGSGEYYIINDLTSLSDSRLTYADNFMSLSDSIKYLENGDSGFFLTEDEKLYVAKEFDIE